MDSDAWERNAGLLRGRLEVEMDAAQAFLEEEAGRLVPGALGRLLNPMVKALLRWVGHEEMRRRARSQLAIVLRAARDLSTLTPEEALARHRDALLATEELYVRGNRAHPDFPALQARVEGLWRERLVTIHRFCTRAEGSEFLAATRAAFPQREELAVILFHQVGETRDIVRELERKPALVKVPAFLQAPAFNLARNALTWYDRRLHDFLDETYGAAP